MHAQMTSCRIAPKLVRQDVESKRLGAELQYRLEKLAETEAGVILLLQRQGLNMCSSLYTHVGPAHVRSQSFVTEAHKGRDSHVSKPEANFPSLLVWMRSFLTGSLRPFPP